MTDSARTLAFTATTATGEVLEFQLPLHPHTSSVDHVGTLIEEILDRVSELVEGPQHISDGDVLQALTLALAVRLRVAGIGSDAAHRLVEELANLALDGYQAGVRVANASRH